MCTSVVNGDVLACSPFCACDSPVCMPWCGEMQCAKEDVGDPDRDMLKNPSCTGCADVDPPVHCQSAGDFKTTAAPAARTPNGGKLIGEEEAEEEEEEEECSLEHLYAEHEMLSAAVARQDQELRRYAAALRDTDRHDSNVDALHDWAHTWEEAAEYNSQHFTRAPAATAPPVCAGNWEQCGGRMSPTASNPGGKWMGPTCCAGAPVNSRSPPVPSARLAPPAPARSRSPAASPPPRRRAPARTSASGSAASPPAPPRAARRRRRRSRLSRRPATRAAARGGRTVGGDREVTGEGSLSRTWGARVGVWGRGE